MGARASILIAATAVGLILTSSAAAALEDEQALAERYAPVVRLVEQSEECGPGEPYEPMEVDALFRRRRRRLRTRDAFRRADDLVRILRRSRAR